VTADALGPHERDGEFFDPVGVVATIGKQHRKVDIKWRAKPLQNCSNVIRSGHWMFGRVFGFNGHESHRKLRLELLCCPTA
jgi:hypothetical protein